MRPTEGTRVAGERTTVRFQRRGPLARPSKLSHGEWRAKCAEFIRQVGFPHAAREFRECAAHSSLRHCEACVDPAAAIELVAGCGLKICPVCARLASQRNVALLESAMPNVAGYTDARRADVMAKLARQVDAARASQEFWSEKLAVWSSVKGRAYATRCMEKAVEREKKAKWQFDRCSDPSWGWKLLTWSPQWNPADQRECEVEGIRDRVRAVRGAWNRALWAGLRMGGLFSAFSRVESSDRAHIHGHALVFMPFVTKQWIDSAFSGDDGRRVFVDVRSADRGAVLEVAKYALKGPSILGAEWLAGKRFRVVHPLFAARFMRATWRVRLATVHGPLRDAIRAAKAIEQEPHEFQCSCVACKGDLSGIAPLEAPTPNVANARRKDFWERTKLVRAPRLGGFDHVGLARGAIALLGRMFELADGERSTREREERERCRPVACVFSPDTLPRQPQLDARLCRVNAQECAIAIAKTAKVEKNAGPTCATPGVSSPYSACT